MTTLTTICLMCAIAQLDAPANSHITLIRADQQRVDSPKPIPPKVLHVGSAKQLFADDWCIETQRGLTRTQHQVQKHLRNPLLKPEEPWEKPCVLISGSVFYDPDRSDDRFRMWYLCYTPKYSADFSRVEKKEGRVAYAISRDGLHWVRPKLGLHEFQGSRDNNIVIDGPYGFPGVIFDPRDPDPKRRYKAHTLTARGHTAYFPEDGIHWSEPQPMNLDGYDRSSVHWDPLQEMWIGSTKSWFLGYYQRQRFLSVRSESDRDCCSLGSDTGLLLPIATRPRQPT